MPAFPLPAPPLHDDAVVLRPPAPAVQPEGVRGSAIEAKGRRWTLAASALLPEELE